MTTAFAEPTIAAIATPPGASGIGVVRMSGKLSYSILQQLFRPRRAGGRISSHKMHHGWVHHPETGELIDEVLAVFMRAPSTYTREDVVEIHCHGSRLILERLLAAMLAAGAQLATPGEFTKRAFLNGRIDLTQAEAVLDLLNARTGMGLDLALEQLQGQLQGQISLLRQGLLEMRAILEVAIDFPEEEGEILDPTDLLARLRLQVAAPLDELIRAAERGRVFREGVAVVILGRPNVGKSSLLNRLLRQERAIVTSIPGTTRDTIEEYFDLKGLPVRIVDTAGIRETAEPAEEIGIRRARQKAAGADLVLLLVDGSIPPEEADRQLLASIGDRPRLLVINKIDIAAPDHAAAHRLAFPDLPAFAVSAITGQGLEDLESSLYHAVTGAQGREPAHGCVPNLRHRFALEKALAATRAAMEGVARELPPDLIAIDLQTALDYLGEIIGETTTEDILDTIFERFCIGK